jgi:tetratricopeptide (TPR) repeat protein
MDDDFSWARVVKHEFVHIINLQQTNFRIPHWYTEALAVYNEGYPRPQKWNAMLARRVPAGKTYNLQNINLGFIRPASSEEWQMAYCQAELYAEYMVKAYGDEALAKLLQGYADNLDTAAAIQRAFDVSLAEFEKGYSDFIKELARGITVAGSEAKKSFKELEEALEESPDDPDLLAAMAIAYLERKAYPKAGEMAGKALKVRPGHQAATYVRARLQMLIGNNEGVVTMLEEALNRDSPQANLLKLLAGLKYKAEDYRGAAELYELGRRKFSGDVAWTKLLARVHLKSGDSAKLRPLLEELALSDGDDLATRKKLAQLAMEDKDYVSAEKWATDAIHIDVMDVEMHRMLGEALVEQEEFGEAIEEYEVAVQLEPRTLHLRFALADACVQADQPEKARKALDELLQLDPDYPGADVLLESLKK